MSRAQTPDRVATQTFAASEVQVRVFRSDPKYASRIEIVDDGRWEFGVDDVGVADVLSTPGDGEVVPDWVQELLENAGVLGINGVGEVA